MKSTILLLLLGGLLAACSTSPLPSTSTSDPSDPSEPIVDAPYRSVLAGTASHKPVAPLPWRELNERVAPPSAGRP